MNAPDDNPCPCCGRPVPVCMVGGILQTDEIIAAAAAAWNVTAAEVTGKGRPANTVQARQLAMAVIRHALEPPPPYSVVAAALNRLDKGTAIHAERLVLLAPEDSRQKRLFRALVLRYKPGTDSGTIPPAD